MKYLLRSTCIDNLRVLCDGCENVQRNDYLVQAANAFLCFVLFSLFFFLFVLITSYYIFHLFFFAFIFKISGPTAIISVNEKSCYLEHGMLRSSRRHYGSLDLRVFLCVQLTPLTQEWAR